MAVKTSWAAGDVLLAADLTDSLAAKFTTPGAWTSYTPTVSASTGTITTSSVGAAKYQQIGKLVVVRLDITITTNGTGAGYVIVTLPVTGASNNDGAFTGRARSVSGKGLTSSITTTSVYIFNYDGTYPASSGETLSGFLIYEAA